MSQKQFDLHFKCTQIEARNGEREAENDALKQEVVSLKFEVKLLKEFMDFEMQGTKDAIIEAQEKLRKMQKSQGLSLFLTSQCRTLI